MMVEELTEWASKNNIEQRAIDGFWKNYRNYKTESPEEFEKVFGAINTNELHIKVNTVSLNLGNWPESSYKTVSASIPLFHKKKNLGNYKILLNLDGTIEDDFFDIY